MYDIMDYSKEIQKPYHAENTSLNIPICHNLTCLLTPLRETYLFFSINYQLSLPNGKMMAPLIYLFKLVSSQLIIVVNSNLIEAFFSLAHHNLRHQIANLNDQDLLKYH